MHRQDRCSATDGDRAQRSASDQGRMGRGPCLTRNWPRGPPTSTSQRQVNSTAPNLWMTHRSDSRPGASGVAIAGRRRCSESWSFHHDRTSPRGCAPSSAGWCARSAVDRETSPGAAIDRLCRGGRLGNRAGVRPEQRCALSCSALRPRRTRGDSTKPPVLDTEWAPESKGRLRPNTWQLAAKRTQ